MKKYLLCLILILLSTDSFSGVFLFETLRTIQVAATGNIFVAPNTVEMRLGCNLHSKSLVRAKSTIDSIVIEFQNKIISLGIKRNSITSSELYIEDSENRSYSPSKFKDFNVGRQVTINLHDISMVDIVLNHAIDCGINSIERITYGHSKSDSLQENAYKKAIGSARENAEIIAKGLDCRIKRVHTIEQGFSQFSRDYYDRREKKRFKISSTVNIIYEIY